MSSANLFFAARKTLLSKDFVAIDSFVGERSRTSEDFLDGCNSRWDPEEDSQSPAEIIFSK